MNPWSLKNNMHCFADDFKTSLRCPWVLVIPYLNLCFLILFLFFINSSFAISPSIEVVFPRTLTSDVVSREHLILILTGENIIYLNNRLVPWKQLRKELARQAATVTSVLIQTDQKASIGRIMDVWDLCRRAGFDQIQLLTTQGQ